MRDDVRLREIAGSMKAPLQLVEKFEIEVDPRIGGTIERPRGRFRQAAGRLNGIAKQTNFCGLIARAKPLLPRMLHVGHHGVDKIDLLFFLRS